MKLVVIGVNHKTAPVALREQLAFVADDLNHALLQLKELVIGNVVLVDSVIILSTCNRSEIYVLLNNTLTLDEPIDSVNCLNSPKQLVNTMGVNVVNKDVSENGQEIEKLLVWLANFKQLSLTEIKPYLYVYQDTHALTHWLRVASGLDSMILGEPQILGQIKQAVSLAQAQGGVSNRMGWIIDQIFSCAKTVRHDTAVGEQAVSLGFAATRLVTQIFNNVQDLTLLLVAAGEMNRLVAMHMTKKLGIKRVIICNRTSKRANTLANDLLTENEVSANNSLTVECYSLDKLSEVLPLADVVSSCSGSMDCLITKSMTTQALKKRNYHPMLMVDLAVPRDIQACVGKIDDIYLYSIDDLQHVIDGNLEQRRQAAVDAEILVSQLVIDIEQRFQVRQVSKDIEIYREMAQMHSDKLLQEAMAKLKRGETPESILQELTYRLTQTLTHPPSKLLQKAAKEGDASLLNLVVEGLNRAYRKH